MIREPHQFDLYAKLVCWCQLGDSNHPIISCQEIMAPSSEQKLSSQPLLQPLCVFHSTPDSYAVSMTAATKSDLYQLSLRLSTFPARGFCF